MKTHVALFNIERRPGERVALATLQVPVACTFYQFTLNPTGETLYRAPWLVSRWQRAGQVEGVEAGVFCKYDNPPPLESVFYDLCGEDVAAVLARGEVFTLELLAVQDDQPSPTISVRLLPLGGAS